MAKGYWIVRGEVAAPAEYQKYVAANAEPIARFGGRFLVRGGAYEAREGRARPRNVVVEFPSFEAAKGCYDDARYRQARALRAAPIADLDFLLIEGYDGPQPGD